MNPKVKAKELVEKFRNVEVEVKFSDRFLYKNEAKECALIAVDEIIDCTKKGFGLTKYSKEYWIEVKKEIEAL